jgi:CRP-like cAMP-binding protein
MLTATSNRAESLQFAAGDAVVRQGDPADRFYIITQGEVTVTRQDPSGTEVQVATLGPGQFFGEIGLLADAPRNATVAARTPIEVLALDRETFRSVTESSEGTAEDLAEVVRKRLAVAPA